MSEIIGHNGDLLQYNGEVLTFAANKMIGPSADVIIKRNAGYAFRPAVRWPYSANNFPQSAATEMNVDTPVFASDVLFTGKIDYSQCHPLRVTTASGAETNPSLYFNYEPSSTEYIYVNLNKLNQSAHQSETIDITNGGLSNDAADYDHGILTAGHSEILRFHSNIADFFSPVANLSDYTAIRDFATTARWGNEQQFTNFYGDPNYSAKLESYGTIADGGVNQSASEKYYALNNVKELENWNVPSMPIRMDNFYSLTSIKNVYAPKLNISYSIWGRTQLNTINYIEKSVVSGLDIASAVYSSNGTSALVSGFCNLPMTAREWNNVTFTSNDNSWEPGYIQRGISSYGTKGVTSTRYSGCKINGGFTLTDTQSVSGDGTIFDSCEIGTEANTKLRFTAAFPDSASLPTYVMIGRYGDYSGSIPATMRDKLFKNCTINSATYIEAQFTV